MKPDPIYTTLACSHPRQLPTGWKCCPFCWWERVNYQVQHRVQRIRREGEHG